MAVRTARLFGPTLISSASVALLLVPDGMTVILKRLRVVNNTAGAVTWRLGIGGTGSGQRLTTTRSIAAAAEAPNEEWWDIFEPGDEIVFTTNTLNALTVTGHGTALDGVAPTPF